MNEIKCALGVVLLALGGAVSAEEGIDPASLGLSKTSVFDTPTPEPFAYSKLKPGKSENLPRAYPGAPPQIPHRVEDSLPITAQENMCLDCHDEPQRWGKKVRKGKATPMPQSHYRDLRAGTAVNKDQMDPARWFCTQCHAPQADAPALAARVPEGPVSK